MPRFHCDLQTAFGPALLASDGTALTGLWFRQQKYFPDSQAIQGDPDAPPFRQVREQFAAYEAGALRDFDLPLAPEGTEFQRAVWATLRAIPFGETLSYGALALRVGRPAAVRAVGAAVGRNPLSVIVPCHRVIGADGSLTGYAGGLPRKRALLAHEASAAARAAA